MSAHDWNGFKKLKKWRKSLKSFLKKLDAWNSHQWMKEAPLKMIRRFPSSLQQCAVEFEIKAFSAESQDAKVRKRWVYDIPLKILTKNCV